MRKRYVLFPEITEEAFLDICKAFEDDYPHFEKHELLYDFLEGEYFQTYTSEDQKITFEITRMWDENDIEVYANFDIVSFVSKVRGTILKKVKIDSDIYENIPRRIHGCCFIVNKTNDIIGSGVYKKINPEPYFHFLTLPWIESVKKHIPHTLDLCMGYCRNDKDYDFLHSMLSKYFPEYFDK